jgi:hypothetical protein
MRSPLLSRAVVEAWFDTLQPHQQPVVQALRQAVAAAGPALAQAVKWGNLVYMHRGRHALAIVVHREHASLQVFPGAALAARHPLLEGSGRDVRHLKLRYGQPVDEALVRALTLDCIDAMSGPPAAG